MDRRLLVDEETQLDVSSLIFDAIHSIKLVKHLYFMLEEILRVKLQFLKGFGSNYNFQNMWGRDATHGRR